MTGLQQKIVDKLNGIPGKKVSQVEPALVWIRVSPRKLLQFEGATYHDENGEHCLWLWGDKPKPRRAASCYEVDGQDWIVACYLDSSKLPELTLGQREMNTFGGLCAQNFIMKEWSCGRPVDEFEPKPYDRLPMMVV